jgi:aspartate beta-hydroxylase
MQALEQVPGHCATTLLAARFATSRRDFDRAASLLRTAFDRHPDESEPAIQLALALAASGKLAEALIPLEHVVSRQPEAHPAWLFLSLIHDRLGNSAGALKAAYQGVTRAQRSGRWLNESTTPPDLLGLVMQAIARVRGGRRELFFDSFAELRAQHGSDALKRMDRALAAYLNELKIVPPDAQQKPLFFYFPDLPNQAYHDPGLQPWSGKLRAAFPAIRAEALAVLQEEDRRLPDFIPSKSASTQDEYLGGESVKPTWQAFFFYRHGKRYDDNHLRCPATSSALDSLELCRIAGQAPEICFSVLRPQTHIKPHHGVTNTRLVMHLPLVVPAHCALNIVDRGVHEWREGELVMFDDTFLHESWNRSDTTRVIVLMDCWNPHLTTIEKLACTQLIEMISSLKPPGARPEDAN